MRNVNIITRNDDQDICTTDSKGPNPSPSRRAG